MVHEAVELLTASAHAKKSLPSPVLYKTHPSLPSFFNTLFPGSSWSMPRKAF